MRPSLEDRQTTPQDTPARLRGLVSPHGGLVSHVSALPSPPGDPRFAVATASLGDTSAVLPEVADWCREFEMAGTYATLDGAGGSLEPDRASWLCIAEALERYASTVYDRDSMRVATARELEADGEHLVDLDDCPRVSEREAGHPGCPLRVPDKSLPQRWVRGVHLTTGRPAWIPAVMVYLHYRADLPGERWWNQISTGCAAHPDLATALAKGLAEVIERDAIALTWLQRLALPRIEPDECPPELAEAMERSEHSHTRLHLFDATTDVGVPTVYAVEQLLHHPQIRTLVMCATEPDPVVAVAKTYREVASSHIGLTARSRTPARQDTAAFSNVWDGALYMGAPERADAFGFLLDSPHSVRLSELPRRHFATGDEELRYLLGRLTSRGLDAYAVDLTCDEALRAGMRVVRTVVPGLMPLSFVHLAQYRGHPRLYDAPTAMGRRALPEDRLNPYPQPFA